MADYSINAVTRKVSYSGSAGVGPYAFNFEVLTSSDIAVYQNSTLLTETTNYTVTVNANGTGSVTLVVAATESDTIVIIGARDIERTTDYTAGGEITAASLNTALDSQVIFTQQVSEKSDRAIQAPAYDPTTINMTLPALDDRKGKFLQFNATTGNPEVSASASDISTLAAVANDIATLADIEDGTDATDAIQTVAGVATNIPTVATNAAAVSAIGNDLNGAAITLDYGDLGAATNPASPTGVIGTIYDNIDTISALSAAADNLAALGAVTTEITALGPLTTEITDLGAITADITAAAAINTTHLSTVAGIAADVTTVAGVTTDLANVTANLSDIQNASTNAANAEAALTNFRAIYLGASGTAPTVDGNGDALTAGDLYYDTGVGQLYVWDGSQWDEAAFNATGAVTSFNTRVGAVTLTSGDVTTALGFTPATALGYTPADVAGDTFTGDVFGTNLTLSGYLRGPSSFTIDPATHGDDTGTLIVAGNLQVDGTTTTINSTTVTIDDLNMTLASGAADAAAANGAGITIDGASASLTYGSTGDDFTFNKSLNSTGGMTVLGDSAAGKITLNCEVNTHGVTIQGPPHSAAATYTLTLPNTDGGADQVLKTDGSGNLDWVDQPAAGVTTGKAIAMAIVFGG